MRGWRWAVLGTVVVLLATACGRVRMDAPEGFAPIKTPKALVAVSPEGVRLRVRSLRNYPEQDLEFWSKALANHLEQEGYHQAEEGERFQAGSRAGVATTWLLPYANQTWTYLTAVVVAGKRIYVAEAAGELTLFRGYHSAILESLRSLRP